MSPNREKHKAQYGKLGKAISQLSNEYSWRERREDFEYEFKGTPSKDPQLSSKLFGPALNTVQWEKTVRRG